VRFKGDDAKADKTYENANALTPEDVTEAVVGSNAAKTRQHQYR
jgi:NADP-dependent 3-hydroxy acid dehydrogenase YdfG